MFQALDGDGDQVENRGYRCPAHGHELVREEQQVISCSFLLLLPMKYILKNNIIFIIFNIDVPGN